MSVTQEHICRLCLKMAINEYEEIDVIIKQLFDVLLLIIDLDITIDSVICKDCIEVAKKCLDFKFTCINTEQCILSYFTNRKDDKQNIEVIYKERKRAPIVFDDKLDICRFCMTLFKRNNCSSLNTLTRENVFHMSAYLPEMDFNTIESPVVCATCRERLGDYHKFLMTCQDTEEKIKSYCKQSRTVSMGQVELGNKMHYMCNSVLEYTGNCPKISVNGIKSEKRRKSSDKIKIRMNATNDLTMSTNALRSDICKRSSFTSEAKQQRSLKNPIKKNEGASKAKISELEMYFCSLCNYKSKYRSNLRAHMLIHKDVSQLKMYKCSLCTFESKLKGNLKQHLLLHKDVSELKMHKCSFCTYESIREYSLKAHMLAVHNVSEIKMYKCSLCAYEAKIKWNLKKHMLIHKDVSEIKMYKCSVCPFEGKRKDGLKIHMLTHKDVSEIKMYKCALCAYQSKFKNSLKNHIMAVHRKGSFRN